MCPTVVINLDVGADVLCFFLGLAMRRFAIGRIIINVIIIVFNQVTARYLFSFAFIC